MEKTIELEKKNVSYTLRISRRTRGVRLSVVSGGMFTVTAPPSMQQNQIEEFILKKSRWVLKKIEYCSKFPRTVGIKNRKRHFAEHREKARILVRERLAYFNQSYHFKWKRIAIRNQRARWGSCSRKGNLNFNYKLALLPSHLSDYIIVHELCHLGELNHSAKFWKLVAKTIPNHRILRKELRKVGMSLG